MVLGSETANVAPERPTVWVWPLVNTSSSKSKQTNSFEIETYAVSQQGSRIEWNRQRAGLFSGLQRFGGTSQLRQTVSYVRALAPQPGDGAEGVKGD